VSRSLPGGTVTGGWVIESLRYDGAQHRTWTDAWLLPPARVPVAPGAGSGRAAFCGEPAWRLRVLAGTPVREADGREWSSDYDVDACFYPDHGQIFVLYKQTGTEFYCNLCLPPHVDATKKRIRYVDMDLDVFVPASGAPELLDESEFRVHKSTYGYRDDECRAILTAAAALRDAALERRGVFACR